MRKLSAALLVYFGLACAALAQVGPPNTVQCNQVTAGTGTGQIATAATGKRIFVCGWDVNANVAAGAFTLVAGTGGSCAVPTQTYAAYTALPVGVFVHHLPYAFHSPTAVSNFCVTAATTVSWTVYWGQY